MKTKTVKITLEGFGSYLGMEKGCFIVKDKQGNTNRYPLFENLIDEIRIKSGNSVSSGAGFLRFLGHRLFVSNSEEKTCHLPRNHE